MGHAYCPECGADILTFEPHTRFCPTRVQKPGPQEPVNSEDVRADVDAMCDALTALSRIPTAARRDLALRWLVERVESDIDKLRHDEHIERVGDAVEAILSDEAQDATTNAG